MYYYKCGIRLFPNVAAAGGAGVDGAASAVVEAGVAANRVNLTGADDITLLDFYDLQCRGYI